MSTGIVSSRYAKAFLRYTDENHSSERVCRQIRGLLRNPDTPASSLDPDLVRLVELLMKNGRLDDMKLVLSSYVSQYFESRHIMLAKLTSAVADETLPGKLTAILEKHFSCKVEIESEVDPDLIGGFVLEVGDYMLDASVSRQIDTIRRQFVINNNRLV